MLAEKQVLSEREIKKESYKVSQYGTDESHPIQDTITAPGSSFRDGLIV